MPLSLKIAILQIFFLLALLRLDSYAQNPEENKRISVFVDCENCDFSFIQNNIRHVNFVRDRYLSDVHVQITFQVTASEGQEYRLNFLGNRNFKGMKYSLAYTSFLLDTEDQRRRGLTQVLNMGLMPYVSQTPAAQLIEIKQKEPAREWTQPVDVWKHWIVHIGLAGQLEAEESQSQFKIGSSLIANRVTKNWKIKSEFKYEFEQENFKDDDENITSKRREWEASFDLIKSLSSHWSAGIFGKAKSTTFRNINLGIGVAPGVEYNFFPWQQSDRRVLSISYLAGVETFKYEEETIFNKRAETLLYGRFRTEIEFIQVWGEADFSLELSHFYHDFSKNRLGFDGDIALRIAKGLAFTVKVEAESIHDQLYLPKGDATLEEILLKQKQLATNYEVSITFGLRYSFGSIYSSVVNRRF